MRKAAVLFSGGVDSSLVAYMCREFADAVTVDFEFVPRRMMEIACRSARKLGLNHLIVKTSMLEELAENPTDRCYRCKKKIIGTVKSMGYEIIIDGINAEDLRKDLPGLRACREENVIHPLADLGFEKADVRKAMSKIDEEIADIPSESCLATRIPFESKITVERLKRIERAEDIIGGEKILVRVRDHFPLAKVEVDPEHVQRMLEMPWRDKLEELGYRLISVDLRGYRG